MNINNKLKLDIFNIALNEISLIEASAGTGKTFTIVMLYLRLLLGMRNSEKNSKKLRVHEILVVTFTNAAKEELYIRIKNGIQNLYLTCIDPKHKDPFFLCFLKEIKDIKEAIDILSKAQNEINNVSIYTIHSFCQNILQLYTFHFNIIFKEKILEDENVLYLQATQDFWRHEFYHLPKNIIKIIYKDYKNPEFLLKKIKPFFNMQSINFLKNEKLLPYHEKNIEKIHSFKKIWLIYYSKISKIIYNIKINKNIYNKSNLTRWLNNITKWAHSKTQDYIIPMELKYFTKTNIKKNTLDDTYQSYILFEKIENLLKNNFSLKNIVLCHAIKKVNKILFKEKKKQFLLGFNDLLNILLKTLTKDKNLRQLIRKKYPVAFIDEFQDTDIQQYNIFNMIYKNHNKTGLFLIGDPKQAIYSFRGADIFSYLYAKSKIKKHYYLDTNWRSSAEMCHSINLLFSQNKNPFIFNNIPYISTIPAIKNLNMYFSIDNINQVPMRFFFHEEYEISLEEYQYWIAKQCANTINYWLNCAKTGRAVIQIKNEKKNITT